MGIADVIPGISGGAIAFIAGIYDEFVHSIRSVDSHTIRLLTRFEFAEFWEKINGSFLAAVLLGMLTSLVVLSYLMQYLLKNYSIMVWAFFFGLIAMATPLMLRKLKDWRTTTILALLMGAGTMYLITTLPPLPTTNNIFFIFLSGSLSVCGLVVPGVSGVSLLMLTGNYQTIVTALNELDTILLFTFLTGCIAGVIITSRIITWALNNYHQVTYALLCGMMLGTLNKIWPWRKVLEYATNVKGDQIAVFDKSVLPWHFLSVTGKDPQLFQAIFMMALGVLIVVVIEKIAVRLKTKH